MYTSAQSLKRYLEDRVSVDDMIYSGLGKNICMFDQAGIILSYRVLLKVRGRLQECLTTCQQQKDAVDNARFGHLMPRFVAVKVYKIA